MECYVGGVVEPTRLRGVNPVIIPGSVQPRPHIVNKLVKSLIARDQVAP